MVNGLSNSIIRFPVRVDAKKIGLFLFLLLLMWQVMSKSKIYL